MEKMNVLTLIITLVVGVILTGAILMPVLDNATATDKTFENDGYFYVDRLTDDETLEYVFADGKLTVNDVEVNLPTSESQYPDGLTILYTEHIVLRYYYSTGLVNVRGVAQHALTAFDLTVSEGTITGVYSYGDTVDSTVSWTYTEFSGISPNVENRIMCKSTPQFIKSDSLIETLGQTKPFSNVSTYYLFHISGSIDDGIEVNTYSVGSGSVVDATISNVVIHYAPVNGYVDLYKLDSITFDVAIGDNTGSATYTIYTVPTEVTADRAQHLNPGEIALMDAIPVMVIVALLMLAVGAIALRRAD